MNAASRRFKIWAAPTALCVLTLIGLTSALIGEQVFWKAVAWLTIGTPVVVAFWYSCVRKGA